MKRIVRPADLLSAIEACYAFRDLATWPTLVLEELRRLIPCELGAFNDIDPLAGRFVAVLSPHWDVPDEWGEIWARVGHQNRAYARLLELGDVGPFRLSDFLSQRELRATELYKLVYQQLGVSYQIATALEGPEPQITAVLLMRDKRDFTLGELELLRLIRPHLLRSYETARTLAGIGRNPETVGRAAERANVLAVTLAADGTIVELTPPAAEMLARHVGKPLVSKPLPEPLAQWVAQTLEAGTARTRSFATRLGVLEVSLSSSPSGAVALLNERGLESAGPLPLSARQREILETIAGGVTNAEAAAILSLSESTIAKHLENIYGKLGVRNRGAALAAYERSVRRAR